MLTRPTSGSSVAGRDGTMRGGRGSEGPPLARRVLRRWRPPLAWWVPCEGPGRIGAVGTVDLAAIDRRARRSISLIELIVVIVILGVLAALAIPRMSRGADEEVAAQLRRELTVLRTAIDLYYQDHHAFPGQRSDGTPEGAAGSEAAFLSQLTQETDRYGRLAEPSGAAQRFGPYLARGIPPCPVARQPGSRSVRVVRGETRVAFDPSHLSAAWIYNCDTGYIAANSDGVGPAGVRYDRY